MHIALAMLALLVLAASLGSWLFSQWLGASRSASALTLALGGIGFVLLIGAAALAVLGTSTQWKSFLPQLDLSRQQQVDAKTAPALARADFGSAEQWPATNCLRPLRAAASDPQRWFIDNECDRVVAVVLAWCDAAVAVCAATNAPQATPAWHYQPSGIVMTSLMAKPTARRLPQLNAPIGGTHALTEPPGATLRIRYLACYLAEDTASALMQESVSADDFQRALLADQCYARVVSGSQAGARHGLPPSISSP